MTAALRVCFAGLAGHAKLPVAALPFVRALLLALLAELPPSLLSCEARVWSIAGVMALSVVVQSASKGALRLRLDLWSTLATDAVVLVALVAAQLGADSRVVMFALNIVCSALSAANLIGCTICGLLEERWIKREEAAKAAAAATTAAAAVASGGAGASSMAQPLLQVVPSASQPSDASAAAAGVATAAATGYAAAAAGIINIGDDGDGTLGAGGGSYNDAAAVAAAAASAHTCNSSSSSSMSGDAAISTTTTTTTATPTATAQ